MITIDPVVLDPTFTYGSKGGPGFSTVITTTDSGSEYAIQRWSQSRGRWNIAYDVKTFAQLLTLQDFYQARAGKARGFLFQDIRDYQATNEPIGTGDGTTTTFQLIRNYTSGGNTTIKNITRPVASSLTFYVNGSPVSVTSMSTTTGIVVLAAAPASGAALTATFEFYFPVRFDSDLMEITLDGINGGWDEVILVELKQ